MSQGYIRDRIGRFSHGSLGTTSSTIQQQGTAARKAQQRAERAKFTHVVGGSRSAARRRLGNKKNGRVISKQEKKSLGRYLRQQKPKLTGKR